MKRARANLKSWKVCKYCIIFTDPTILCVLIQVKNPDIRHIFGGNTTNLDVLSEQLETHLSEGKPIEEIFSNPSVGLAIIRYPGFVFVRTNPAYQAITPHPEIEPAGRSVAEIWPPSEGYFGTDGLSRVIETGIPISAEQIEVHYHTGVKHYLDVRVDRILWNHKSALLMLVRESVGEQMLEALRTSEDRFAKAFRASPDGLIISRKEDDRIIDVNQGFERIFGYSQEGSLGKTPTDLHLYPDSSEYQDMLVKLEEHGSLRDYELEARTQSGIACSISISVENITIDNQACLLTIVHDITERKQLEQSLQQAETALQRTNQVLEERVTERTRQLNEANLALRQEILEREQAQAELKSSKNLFERLFDATPDPIFLIDSKGKITRLNQQAADTFGYAPEELQGQVVEILLPERSRQKHRDHRSQYWEAPTPHPMGLDMGIYAVKKDGSEFPVDITLSTIEIGGDLQVVCVLHDITHPKQMAAELAEVQRRLMDSVEIERKRLAQELHDGPMQEIYGLIYQLADLGGKASETELEEVRTKLNEINDTLRAIARDLRPPAAQFGLEKAIREHADRFQQEHPELIIELELMPDGNELSETLRVTLFRIYQIALTNALRHAHAHRVTVRFTFDSNLISLEVTDDGSGFVVPKRWWVNFARQGHLGLVGAAERVEAIGGRLEVESEINQGTCVRATIPRVSGIPTKIFP